MNKCSVLWRNAKLGIRGDFLEQFFCFVLYFSFITRSFQLSVTKKGTLLCVACRKGYVDMNAQSHHVSANVAEGENG